MELSDVKVNVPIHEYTFSVIVYDSDEMPMSGVMLSWQLIYESTCTNNTGTYYCRLITSTTNLV
ncbi:hypothetical protein BBBOND_0203720 [Babesia bigemina]|uniref:Uncharacterized protein n=1 Tax=Babesia bigemina TaxID=5866 RepID=A0A061D8H0_BABBI|nr:hypothetical protein BBBOND_0203720 [Babesia bigemina]CDR95214.1 hypothetical protein BBBOND_0203720 [Babesia bigemina]|eukprot:XP_012767400.1 hypothetical protein BBBOND_0203720 [Babesia bigemina]